MYSFLPCIFEWFSCVKHLLVLVLKWLRISTEKGTKMDNKLQNWTCFFLIHQLASLRNNTNWPLKIINIIWGAIIHLHSIKLHCISYLMDVFRNLNTSTTGFSTSSPYNFFLFLALHWWNHRGWLILTETLSKTVIIIYKKWLWILSLKWRIFNIIWFTGNNYDSNKTIFARVNNFFYKNRFSDVVSFEAWLFSVT